MAKETKTEGEGQEELPHHKLARANSYERIAEVLNRRPEFLRKVFKAFPLMFIPSRTGNQPLSRTPGLLEELGLTPSSEEVLNTGGGGVAG